MLESTNNFENFINITVLITILSVQLEIRFTQNQATKIAGEWVHSFKYLQI